MASPEAVDWKRLSKS